MVIGYDEDNAGGTAAEGDGSDRQSIEVSSRRTSRCLILSVVTRPTHSSDANSRQRGLPQNAGSAGTYICTISARAHDVPTTQPTLILSDTRWAVDVSWAGKTGLLNPSLRLLARHSILQWRPRAKYVQIGKHLLAISRV